MIKIVLSKKAKKQLKKIPAYIAVKLQKWSEDVEEFGIEEVRKIPGRHDEPLSGSRKGQRSTRLSKDYRAFYIESNNKITINVIEVNKHDY